MAATDTPIKLGGLARTLVQEKLLTVEEAEVIQKQANTLNVPFVSQIASSKKLTALKVAEAASAAFGFPLLDLNTVNPDYLPKAIDVKLLQSYRVLGLQQRGNTLFVALSDPTNLHALDDVQFQTGMTLSPVVVEDDKLGRMIEKVIEQSDTSLKSLSVDDDIDLDIQSGETQAESEDAAAATARSWPDGSAGAIAALLTTSIFEMVAWGLSLTGETSMETSPPTAYIFPSGPF